MEQDKHKKAFEELAEELLEEFKTVDSVTLFGSVARDEHGARSDVDVLVETADRSETQEIETLAFQKASKYGVSITPIIKPANNSSSSFVENIRKKGETRVRS